ncbi:hypothetical protein SUGI_0890430 [Cryptomeria japonica]|uniref:histidine-containing phosphotransfer protein 1 n=1 Tax=Cryptomeria japonica TaxID=3369 RepID=UPI00241494D7|nr:histidine-containing phosphotransfer protein 1 [Cryptomeria japonica]GLJ42922.1 hypothetical protein SUGI_0890430 [Cryptomeria japonica]
MDVAQLQRAFVEHTNSLFHEGYLDEQFTQLQQLQDESNPEFVVEVVSLFFEDAEKIINDLSKTLDQHPTDFQKVDAYVHQFKGSSSSIGAHRVKNLCIPFRAFCDERNKEGCIQCLQQVKQEYYVVKNKLETLFRLEHQILEAGGTIPMAD